MEKNQEGEHNDIVFKHGEVKRNYQRFQITGFACDLIDERVVLVGVVRDLSVGGFCISHQEMPEDLDKLTYNVVVSGGGRRYKLLAKPCWQRKGESDNEYQIGFKILDAPWEWLQLTMDKIFKLDENKNFIVQV